MYKIWTVNELEPGDIFIMGLGDGTPTVYTVKELLPGGKIRTKELDQLIEADEEEPIAILGHESCGANLQILAKGVTIFDHVKK